MRLIDADALKGEKFYSHERHENCVSVYAIDMMPTIEPERPHGEWIPCSERLPEEGKLILVTLNPISLKDSVHPVIITKYTTEKDSWIHTIPDAVLAWMPLPEPYKREGEAE